MKNYFKLLKFLKGQRKVFVWAVIFMAISTLLEGIQLSMLVPMTDIIFNKKKIVFPGNLPSPVSQFVDQLNAMSPEVMLSRGILVVLVLLIIKNLIAFGYGYLMNDLSQRIMRDIRYELYKKIQSLSLDFFSKKRGGELISRITHDVQVIENALSYGVTDLFRQTFTILMFVGMAFFIHPNAALVIFVFFPLLGIPISRIGRKLKKISKSSQSKMADINSLLLETISGIQVVKAFCTEQYEVDRFRKQNHEFYKLKMKSIKRLLLISPITEIAGAICGLVLIMLLGRQVIADQLSFGVFVLFFGSIMSII